MFHSDTLRECFVYNDWARDRVLTAAAGVSDEQLDRPFPMGPGSLCATLQHLYGAERIWFERWQGTPQPQFPRSRDLAAVNAFWQAHRALAAARDAALATLADTNLQRTFTYTNAEGRPQTLPLGGMLLHVCNHGTHHRAQTLNMLRHLGTDVPKLDMQHWLITHP